MKEATLGNEHKVPSLWCSPLFLFISFFCFFSFLFLPFPFYSSETASFHPSFLYHSSQIQKQSSKAANKAPGYKASTEVFCVGRKKTASTCAHRMGKSNALELVVSCTPLSLRFCLRWMGVLRFAVCILLDFFFQDLMSWIIMSLGFWCFRGCMKSGAQRKIITVCDTYQLPFITLINLEAFRSCKHTWKPQCSPPSFSPRAHGKGNRCFIQTRW